MSSEPVVETRLNGELPESSCHADPLFGATSVQLWPSHWLKVSATQKVGRLARTRKTCWLIRAPLIAEYSAPANPRKPPTVFPDVEPAWTGRVAPAEVPSSPAGE